MILMLLWLLGMATSYPMGGLIHVSLVVAIVIVLVWFIQGRRPSLIKADQARGPARRGTVADLADPDDLSRFEGEGGAQAPEPAAHGREPYQSLAAAIGDPKSPEATLHSASKKSKMNISKCPHCGLKLGNFLYADACPHCHEELLHNTTPLLSAPKHDSQKVKLWPVRMFTRLIRFVES